MNLYSTCEERHAFILDMIKEIFQLHKVHRLDDKMLDWLTWTTKKQSAHMSKLTWDFHCKLSTMLCKMDKNYINCDEAYEQVYWHIAETFTDEIGYCTLDFYEKYITYIWYDYISRAGNMLFKCGNRSRWMFEHKSIDKLEEQRCVLYRNMNLYTISIEMTTSTSYLHLLTRDVIRHIIVPMCMTTNT